MWPQECQPSETENRLMPFNMLPLTFSHEKYPNIQTRDSTKFFIISFLCPIICQSKIYEKTQKKHCSLLHCWFLLSLLFLFLLVLNYFRHVPHFPMFLISRLRIISDTPPPFSNVWKQKSCRLSTVYLLKSKQLDNQQKVSNWKTAKTPSHCAFSEIWLFLIYGQYQWL